MPQRALPEDVLFAGGACATPAGSRIDAGAMPQHTRFLVVVRAGDASLHPGWTRAPEERDWDLVVSYFGDDPQRFRGAHERRIDDKGQKWPGLHALLTRESFWRGYDYVWLPDDDLVADQADISGLFRTTAGLGLALTQPALSWTSHYSHALTVRRPSFSVRMTNFVEIMAPCFERRFLEACLPTFGENLSGWGLDLLWPRLLPEGSLQCAIVDDVAVTHTRAVGGPGYDHMRVRGLSPWQEGEALLRRHGIPPATRPCMLAAIDRQGNRLEGNSATGLAALRELEGRDWAAFQAARAPEAGGSITESERDARR